MDVNWVPRMDVEHDNLRAAIDRTLTVKNLEIAQRLCGALGRYWDHRGHWAEAQRWLAQSLGRRTDTSKSTQAKALLWRAHFAWRLREYEEATEAASSSLSLFQELNDLDGEAEALIRLGVVQGTQEEHADAKTYFERALAIFQAMGEPSRGHATVLNNLGVTESELGNEDAARQYWESSLQMADSIGIKSGRLAALNNLGHMDLEEGDGVKARTCFNEALMTSLDVGNLEGQIRSILHASLIKLKCEGDPMAAAQLLGTAEEQEENLKLPVLRGTGRPHLVDDHVNALRESLGDDAYEQAFQSGNNFSLEKAVELARDVLKG